MWAKHKQAGFTIVELLIVIVVIGILAAITIVAYNGIQGRAQAAAVSSALEQTSKKLALYAVDNSTYPIDLATIGINNTSGTSYQYSVNNTVSPHTYCVTATASSTSYMISQLGGGPVSGACMAHSLGGIPLVHNFMTNPSLEVDTTGYDLLVGATINRVTSGLGVVAGNAALEVIATTANQSGVRIGISNLLASTTYTFSGYVTLVSGDTTALCMRTADGAGTTAVKMIDTSLVVSQPVRLDVTWISSASPATSNAEFWRCGAATSPVTFRIDAIMVEQGTASTRYSES